MGACILFCELARKRPLLSAIKSTIHETTHMLIDPGPGIVGIHAHHDARSIKRNAAYRFDGRPRTPVERLRISRAPKRFGLSMSSGDMAQEEKALLDLMMDDFDGVSG